MQNENFREANMVAAPVPSGTKTGDPLRLGDLNAVAATDRAKTDVAPYNPDGTPNTSYNWGGGNVDGEASVWLAGSYTFEDSEVEITEWGQPVYITPDGDLSADPDDGGSPTPVDNFLFGHALNVKDDTAGPLTVRLAN